MLRSIKEVNGYKLLAKDGEIGQCRDFLFDDEDWTIRYMVADTGGWLSGRKVIISPISLGKPEWKAKQLPVRLTKQQIEDAPPIEDANPVSRQHEIKMHRFYGWPYYWVGNHAWGVVTYPGALYDQQIPKDIPTEAEEGDKHLRSVDEVTGYHVQATDGDIGHVEDFIIDDETMSIRYIVIDTHNILPGKKVLIAPQWCRSIEWSSQNVAIKMTGDEVKNAPEYDPLTPISSEYEAALFEHYNKP